MGGSDDDWGMGIAVAGCGGVYVTGGTYLGGWASGGFDESHNGGRDGFVARIEPGRQWTIMVYMNGDNNLEGAYIDQINVLESVALSDSVELLLQFDRCEDAGLHSSQLIPYWDEASGDWTDTRRGRVIHDSDMDAVSSVLDPVVPPPGSSELSMGDSGSAGASSRSRQNVTV